MGLGGIGFQELLIIFLLVLLLFGAKRIPEVGKALGKGIREFKRASKEIRADVEVESREEEDGDDRTPPDREAPKG
ncbi:MAG: twin-arginine translocase TatA/TatE family subunit [Candidatus Eisenbacteria bacterium]|nr:twin-arginine translocase TatA/TatE family subunit [Candidatus Eisenbacteria bacterium]